MSNNNKNSKSLNSIIKQSARVVGDKDNKVSKSKSSKKDKVLSTDSVTSDSPDFMTSSAIKLHDVIYPCKDKELYTRVMLKPHQMNDDLYLGLKKNLIDVVEGKCTKDGYVVKVYKIVEYKNGVIEPENFTGSAVYDVKYLAKVCSILKETIIVAKITSYVPNAGFALADFGPIVRIIFTKNERDINSKIFMIGNDKNIFHILTQKKLAVNDYVKIQIKSIKFSPGDTVIKCMGYLDNLADPEEIDLYAYKDDILKQAKQNDNLASVYFNEDNEIEDKNIDESFSKQSASNINDI
jgi:DNA-directed RNA polymerase subunit E'/Rpb7